MCVHHTLSLNNNYINFLPQLIRQKSLTYAYIHHPSTHNQSCSYYLFLQHVSNFLYLNLVKPVKQLLCHLVSVMIIFSISPIQSIQCSYNPMFLFVGWRVTEDIYLSDFTRHLCIVFQSSFAISLTFLIFLISLFIPPLPLNNLISPL